MPSIGVHVGSGVGWIVLPCSDLQFHGAGPCFGRILQGDSSDEQARTAFESHRRRAASRVVPSPELITDLMTEVMRSCPAAHSLERTVSVTSQPYLLGPEDAEKEVENLKDSPSPPLLSLMSRAASSGSTAREKDYNRETNQGETLDSAV